MAPQWSTSNSPAGIDLHLDLAVRTAGGRRANLERALRTAVRDGRLAPGTRLPATRVLAAELGVARGTVTAAYEQLAAEGYLAARRGSGTVVADLPRAAGDDRSAGGSGPRPPVHDLRPGRPDLAAFPLQAWLRAARRALPAVPPAALGTGCAQGRAELRTALAEYLGRTRGLPVRAERIVVTAGFQQALSLVAEVLHQERGCRALAMEDPCLSFHRDAVRRTGTAVLPLPVDARGAVAEVPAGAGAALVTPAHQALLGAVLAPERRRALADWAATGDRLLLEDDYDAEFRYDRQPVGALSGVVPDRSVYFGTASKTLAPGLRLGWAVLPPDLVRPVARARAVADGGAEAFGQLVLAELLRSHVFDRHVRAMRQRYRHRRDLLVRRLAGAAPRGSRLVGAAAGLHAVLLLPDGGPGEQEVLARARRRGVALEGLAGAWHDPDRPGASGLLIGYGAPSASGYPAALDALAEVLEERHG